VGGVLLVFLVAVAGMVVGALRGGQLDGFGKHQVRWAPILLVGLALQGATSLAAALGWLSGAVPVVMVLALLATLAFTFANVSLPGMVLIAIGVLCNLTVLLLNGGMPVTQGALERADLVTAGRATERPDATHVLVDDDTRLSKLGDVLAVHSFRRVVSVGDIAQYAGLFLLIQGLMAGTEQTLQTRFKVFDYSRRPRR
jgi:Family of unknown function (DUF5317)